MMVTYPSTHGVYEKTITEICGLVHEAGGFVTDFRGRSPPFCDAQVLAGNDAIHSRLHKLVTEALKT